MKLYYAQGTCSLAIRILIHEIGIQCEYEAVNLKTKQTETDMDFFKINPKGSVPVLQLDNKEILTENAVIHQYLADKNNATQLLPALGDFNRYHVLEWLNFISTDIHKGFGPFFNPNIPDAIKENIFKPILKNKLALIDTHLKTHKFLIGEHVTLPDGYLYVTLRWANAIKMEIEGWPNLARYFNDMQHRKAVQEALKEEGLA